MRCQEMVSIPTGSETTSVDVHFASGALARGNPFRVISCVSPESNALSALGEVLYSSDGSR